MNSLDKTTPESKSKLSPALREARKKLDELKKAGIPVKQLNPIEKSDADPKSLRKAINARCYYCEGEDSDPAVRWRIGNCLVMGCPLRKVRPYQELEGTPVPRSLRGN